MAILPWQIPDRAFSERGISEFFPEAGEIRA
jgi:hypothetical protein